MNLNVLGGLFEEKMNIRCQQGHEFDIPYSKKLSAFGCAVCKKNEREQWKESLRQEEKRRQEENLRRQERLFEEARKEMGHNLPSDSNWQQSHSSLSYWATIEEQVNMRAKQLTEDYLRD